MKIYFYNVVSLFRYIKGFALLYGKEKGIVQYKKFCFEFSIHCDKYVTDILEENIDSVLEAEICIKSLEDAYVLQPFKKKKFFIFNHKNLIYFYSKIKLFFLMNYRGFIIFCVLSYTYLNIFFFFKVFVFNKYLVFFVSFFFFVYWLFSNFFYFNKVYNFSKYTSLNQRFWKRNLILFWLIEIFLFLIYIYFYLNYSAESMHFSDKERIFKNLLAQTDLFYFSNLNYGNIIMVLYFFIIFKKLKYKNFFFNFFSFINFFLTYCLFFEFFQFLFICNNNIYINFDYDSNTNYLVSVEKNFEKFRLYKNYFVYCFLLKFWHFILALLFYLFYLFKYLSKNITSYDFFVCNLQNFLFIYLINYFYMIYWFKFFFRYFLDFNYFWLFYNNNVYNSFFSNARLVFFF